MKPKGESLSKTIIVRVTGDEKEQAVRATKAEGKKTVSDWAREKLGWTPRTTFGQLVSEMVREELKLARLESLGTDERSVLSVTKG